MRKPGCATRKNTISVFGRFNVSQKYLHDHSPDIGYQYIVYVSKPSGKFQFRFLRQETNKKYDPNDLGFLLYNNETINQLRLSYYEVDPFWKFINCQTDLFIQYSTLNQPASFTTLRLSLQNATTFSSYWNTSITAEYQPLGFHDYYEPRLWGKVFKTPMSYYIYWNLASDAKKVFRHQQNFSFSNCPGINYFDYNIGLTPRIRFSDRFSMTLDVQYTKELNSYGWVETDYNTGDEPVIYFGRRDITTISNVLTSQFIFNTKTSLSLRLRHYWSQAEYLQYYTLNNDGNLDPGSYWQNHNINFNAFTVDLQFVWYFAPGSELSVVWKNLINTMGDELENNYFTNFANTMDAPQTNSFSFRVLYYLDYLSIKKVFRKRNNR